MVYGTGTRSYNRSTEKRQMDRERAEFSAKVDAGEIKSPFAEVSLLLCHCRSFRFSHEPSAHKQLQYGDLDWTPWQRRQNFRAFEERPR